MFLKKWEDLPEFLRTAEVYKYYQVLAKRKGSLVVKRIIDIVIAGILLLILLIPMLLIALLIALDSPGGVFYRQVRVTTYGRTFRIFKFRTMVSNADKIGTLVTVEQDARITRVGAVLRKYRLDEVPQLINVLQGTMSFVGTRPEVPKYVQQYSNEMQATLLLPAGITSEASIRYKDEAALLNGAENLDAVYVQQILPQKMRYNLQALENFSIWAELGTMIRTVFAVLGKNYD